MGRTDPIRVWSAAVKSLADEKRGLCASRLSGTGSSGTVWVCCSASICRRCSKRRRNRYALSSGRNSSRGEESIRIIQRQNFIVREQIQFSQCAERLEHTRFLQKRITRAMDKLQRLHDELDVANAAAPKFYVALQLFRPN